MWPDAAVSKRPEAIDVKNVFYYSDKKRVFNVFYFLERSLFSTGIFFILLNLLNSCTKRLLSDGFNIAAIGNSLMKSCSP